MYKYINFAAIFSLGIKELFREYRYWMKSLTWQKLNMHVTFSNYNV